MKTTDQKRQLRSGTTSASDGATARHFWNRQQECEERGDRLLSILSRLSPVERQAWALIARDYSNLQIAGQMAISVLATRILVHDVLAKLEVHSRSEAAALARECGLVQSSPGAERRGPATGPETETGTTV